MGGNRMTRRERIYQKYGGLCAYSGTPLEDDWLPIKGTSRIYNHAFKLKARKDAVAIETLAIPCAGSQDNTFKCMMDMVHAVMVLTNDVSLNPECE